jgi:hypothetical protein
LININGKLYNDSKEYEAELRKKGSLVLNRSQKRRRKSVPLKFVKIDPFSEDALQLATWKTELSEARAQLQTRRDQMRASGIEPKPLQGFT